MAQLFKNNHSTLRQSEALIKLNLTTLWDSITVNRRKKSRYGYVQVDSDQVENLYFHCSYFPMPSTKIRF